MRKKAELSRKAEVRVPFIRGQLRWWLRLLGGFNCLSEDACKLESNIFGSAVSSSLASKPIIKALSVHRSKRKSKENLGAGKPKNRQAIEQDSKFKLQVRWKGAPSPFSSLNDALSNMHTLINIWIHLRALGAKSSKEFGAMTFTTVSSSLAIEEGSQFF
ncbi:type III-B CRISPR module RAMP protein Cmr1 [Candidatus Methylacidiphilum fumarolicum]|uniref:CRISPR type III-associated protein domain-containing protein n=2 Tax=Candidatus Methylacidiphilum fumarolicum TaxID=591154 RepID=I0JZ01_METFB|nr:type III-B CRISPR module RAMP protein Cmr1 [Candidatus Methylacidiphilum fumarolicum]MBW6414639.1 type III-B CRISPR module RAMP protein Cmr1 [Candidatus Methylacidiphilum fumarolicum]TFE65659.1 type III-B CRISPR module RAMP protein Cmr1 [Candidatus Methylacidiphilum fumarolicum]TFE74213.1 type III-B CRISPR module RAMP protein Cmr1 [Candidatus Methylacidiphilum fumarolicum]TFE75712.1 type III-B CRISPR module RAMP protein Cmr1 [Candidatus Methylacidiphilum fumarolicum]TFE75872.1 type III-B CR